MKHYVGSAWYLRLWTVEKLGRHQLSCHWPLHHLLDKTEGSSNLTHPTSTSTIPFPSSSMVEIWAHDRVSVLETSPATELSEHTMLAVETIRPAKEHSVEYGHIKQRRSKRGKNPAPTSSNRMEGNINSASRPG